MPSTSKSNRRRPPYKPAPKVKQRWQVKQPTRNWLELPLDVTANILQRLGAIEILENAQKVCTTWRRICKDPAMWRVIDMQNLGDLHDMPCDLEKMCMHAVDRSEGQLVDINIEYFGTDELLQYIAERSSQLRRLQIACCYGCVDEGLIEALEKLPLLEELNLTITDISKEAIEVAGRCCPQLRLLKLNGKGYRIPNLDSDEEARLEYNEAALAIGANLPELRHLQLIGNSMSNVGLQAILDGCPHLESLDLRRCPNISLGGDLGKRCSEKIKNLRLPCDSMDGYKFDAEIEDNVALGQDYPSGYSDLDSYDDYEYYGYSDYDDFTAFDEFGFSEFDDLDEWENFKAMFF